MKLIWKLSLTEQVSDVKSVIQNSVNAKIKPGITGLAQLRFEYTSDAEGAGKKLRWDLVYLQSLGFRTETHLVLRTFTFVMKGLVCVFSRNPFKRPTKTGSGELPFKQD